MPLLLGPILAQVFTLTAQDATSVRARKYGDDLFYDADTRPSLELRLDSPRTSWSIDYGPTLTLDALGPDAELVILHVGSASASIRWRHHFLTLSQQGGYGKQNFLAAPLESKAGLTDPNSPPLPTAVPEGQSLQLNEVIHYGFSTSSLSLSHLLTRRLVLSELVGFDTSSGFDDLARTVYPLQREGLGSLTFGYALTRRDTLFTQGQGRYVVTGSVHALVVGANERWAKQWARGVSTELGVGATYSDTKDSSDPTREQERKLRPVANVALDLKRGRPQRRDSLDVNCALTTDVDRTTGLVDQRVVWGLTSEHTLRRATFSLSTSGSQSVERNTDAALTSITGGVSAEYAFTNELSGSIAFSSTWQDFAGLGNLPLFWTGGLGVSYAIEPVRF